MGTRVQVYLKTFTDTFTHTHTLLQELASRIQVNQGDAISLNKQESCSDSSSHSKCREREIGTVCIFSRSLQLHVLSTYHVPGVKLVASLTLPDGILTSLQGRYYYSLFFIDGETEIQSS